MKTKKILSIVAASIMCCVFAASVYAEEAKKPLQPELDIKATQIIRLHYLGGISPADTTVQAGTTVIWMNDSRSPVQLQFEGEQVTMACKSPVNFVIDEHGSFISNLIPQGSVASLCFVEKGDFDYVLRRGATGATYERRERVSEFRGKIIVK